MIMQTHIHSALPVAQQEMTPRGKDSISPQPLGLGRGMEGRDFILSAAFSFGQAVESIAENLTTFLIKLCLRRDNYVTNPSLSAYFSNNGLDSHPDPSQAPRAWLMVCCVI